MEDGTHRIIFAVTVYYGAQAGRYDLWFDVGLYSPPSTASQLQFFWPPNGGVDVCQFLTITPTSGSGQATPPNTAFANPLVAKVTDSADNAVLGVLVTFTGPGSGASIAVAMAESYTAGVVSATVKANGTAGGPYTVTAALGAATAGEFSLANGTSFPSTSITGVLNNASGQPGIASGSWVSIYGSNLSATTRSWRSSDFSGNNLPTSLDGVSVKINGKSAAVYYVSPGQLNVQSPADDSLGQVQVVVTNSWTSATGTATLQTYAPGFFAFQGEYVAAVHTDGAYVAPVGYFGGAAASRPAQPGEVLMLFGTGFGPTTPAVPAGQIFSGAAPLTDPTQLQITIGGVVATVQFAGIVAAGEYQFNVVVPALPDGDQRIVATIGGMSTQSGLSIPTGQ
jgi:uncharacterized protein (TIGR03437 family)